VCAPGHLRRKPRRTTLLYARLADLVLLTHLAFILFVTFGGLLVIRRRRVAWVHLPVLLYGAAIEIVGWICPLTPLEQRLRREAGQAGYEGGFIEHYVGELVYPAAWGYIHVWLGLLLIVFNAAVYGVVLWRLGSRPAG
jgi:hypothetical protein